MRYWSGLATGVAAFALVLFGILAFHFMPIQATMYQEFKGLSVPQLTRIAMSPAWCFSVPILALAALLLLNLVKLSGRREIN